MMEETTENSDSEPREPIDRDPPFPVLIDNTARSNWERCQEYFFRASLQQVRLRGKNIHLSAGGAFAKGLEVCRRRFFEDGWSVMQAEQAGLEALRESYPKVPMVPARNGDKSLENVEKAFGSYWLTYPLKDGPVLPMIYPNGQAAVEFRFCIAIPGTKHPETGDPILYAGRFDMLGLFKDMLWVVDEKTATQLGDQWRNNWTLDSQFTGYCWAARQWGYPVAGAIVRGIGLLKTKITHEEVITYRPEWQIDRWLEQLQYEVEDMITAWKRKRFHKALDKHSCNAFGGCAYTLLCESPHPEQWLDNNYEVVHWNPLEPH